ncbi:MULTISPECIES: lasso peptide biosynthesis B2 protein [Streptomyces]|uniref:Lasso peptide biosynthesis B2 protein n=1 Tax=Streptomyces durocortorensis TaxID=2811104 RepID=A0ABS2HV64_9ACTN|nr:lasso peptide biosynthesis B2 protein [Streptomyces durocortorensis]MBM7054924.1 lasso peptide biosynthesis B2 protein [Streptomyces durocortorensis]
MSIDVALDRDRTGRPLRLRLLTRLAICAARPLALLKPHLLTRVLTRLSRGAAPASSAQVHAARGSVLAASLSLNGLRSCLPRSVSITLLCRLQGVWPTWCVGVRAAPPFAAHAWVEADGEMIGERGRPESFARLIAVSPFDRTKS